MGVVIELSDDYEMEPKERLNWMLLYMTELHLLLID